MSKSVIPGPSGPPAENSGHQESAFAGRLAALPAAERDRFLLDFVTERTAAVLAAMLPGAAGGPVVDGARPFRDQGLDSLAAMDLHARLTADTGLDLPVTAAFDYPTPAALASYLRAAVSGTGTAGPATPAAGAAAVAEPVAIVGIGCRFPGGVRSAEDLWDLVAGAAHVIGDFPTDRGWDLAALYDPDPGQAGTSYVRTGGFLPDAAEFDAEFFGIAPREALSMDPQQRLVLETSWEALERAAIDPTSLRGTPTGVFIGAEAQEYGPRLHEAPEGMDGYLLTGNAASVISGRVAYVFGLEGPTLTVDTACSGSLVALHLAAQALRHGECALALAGGVAVMAGPGTFTAFSRQRGLAADGRCKAFAAAADGTGFAEGAGVFVLERLPDAVRNGHRVLALIRGSAVNSDGGSNGLTAPNGPSQDRVIRQALADARLTADQVDAVEAHGTGTRLGDPIEARALLAAYGQRRERPLWLGSVKSNIGHTQAAAGTAGVVKMVMAIQHGVLPRTLHVDAPTPHVDWTSGSVELLTEAREWADGGHPRRSGVSSFGVSGTNAHMIIEQAPPWPRDPAGGPAAPPLPAVPIIVSAKTGPALRAQAARLTSFLDSEAPLADVGCALAARARLDHRAVVVARDIAEARDGLAAIAEGTAGAGTWSGMGTAGGLAMLFTGQGAQRLGMGQELAETFPVFAQALDEASGYLNLQLDQPLRDVMWGTDAALLDQTGYAQCALFAVEVALYRLLYSWGLAPQVVLGHSLGELAAAHVAGLWSLEDACTVVAARGRLMQALPGVAGGPGRGRGGTARPSGAMMAVQASEAEVRPLLGDGLSIAAVNGPSAVVISGRAAAVRDVARQLKAAGRRTTRLRVSHAFHSPLMEPMLAEFEQILRVVTYSQPLLPVVSNLTGEPATPAELRDPGYWTRHVRETVRFADGIRSVAGLGAGTCLELGPDPVLSAMAPECLDGGDLVFVPALRRDRAEPATLISAVSAAYARGAAVDWAAFFAGRADRHPGLPTYAFQRRHFWLPAATGPADAAGFGQVTPGHPLLSAGIDLAGHGGLVLTGRIGLRTHPWLADHAVAGAAMLPGTAFVDMALHAAAQAGCELVTDLTLHEPLVLPENGGAALQVTVGAPGDDGRRVIEFHSRPDDESADGAWTRHATGLLDGTAGPPPADLAADGLAADGLAAWPPPGAERIQLGDLYAELAGQGYDYGPAFRALRAAWRRDGDVFAEATLAEDTRSPASAFAIHPALLDAILHATDFAAGEAREPGEIRLPFAWTGVRLYTRGTATLRARITSPPGGGVSLTLADASGALVASAESFRSRPLPAGSVLAGRPQPLYSVDWVPVRAAPAAARLALLGPDGLDLGDGIPLSGDLDAIAASGAPDAVLLSIAPGVGQADPVAAAERTLLRVLDVMQRWLGDDRFAASRLVMIVRDADRPAGRDGLASAPVRGLVRSAQAEHPGRFVLLDLDPEATAPWPLAAALASAEPELRITSRGLLAPRLSRLRPPGPGLPKPWEGAGTVLITGGTGGLGALVARHLAGTHGVRHLLLASRRGPDAPGAARLVAALERLGTSADVAACDVADTTALAGLLDRIPVDRPLTGVVHAAGVLDNGLIDALTPGQVEAVLRPKLAAAWRLHELTSALPLSAFVLFSSSAGLVDGAGQGNYSAANVFLDALAAYRRERGLPATSLSWGLWSGAAGMGSQLGTAGLKRIERLGLAPLTPQESLAALDAAVATGPAAITPVRVDGRALRSRADGVPAMLRGLAAAGPSRAVPPAAPAAGGRLLGQLAGLPDGDRDRAVLDLVRTQVAVVLGHDGPDAISPRRAFSDIGFDSLAAVELRNALGTMTGLPLPATVIFDHPSPRALADHILDRLAGPQNPGTATPVVPAAEGEPIAIIAMSCRYPGGVGSPEDLWQLVAQGRDAMTPFPAGRGWDVAAIYDPEPGQPGKSYVNQGGFLAGAADFDADFFDISPREAQAMDPQQRLLLEISWEAFERAGIDPLSVRGSGTGVFAGVMYHDWGTRLGAVPEDVAGYLGNGSLASVVSGRVSYALGLEGPTVTVDTACSSSLVALHWAIQALQRGECTLALAGGVTVMSTPDTFIDFSRQRGLAADGRCKPFAAAADGTGWGEGAGMLLIERLSDALRQQHPVLAVIRGSAVNHDGASNGLTAPSGPAQQRVIRRALAEAGLRPSEVDAVEAHGTGTTLGDPIEAQALLATYGQDRDRPLWLGSVKSNLGHTQAAAGVAGVIKMVMALRGHRLPRTLHVDQPSPLVDWSAGAVELLTEERPWPETGLPRRAGVSSFGISGTNAHVIVEQAPSPRPVPAGPGNGAPAKTGNGAPAVAGNGAPAGTPDTGPRHIPPDVLPFLLSGRTAGALRAQAAQLRSWAADHADVAPGELARALATSRASLRHRAAVVAADRDELLRGLDAIATGGPAPAVTYGTENDGKLAFLFSGQGAQRVGMGRELYRSFPGYAQAFDAVTARLDGQLDRPLHAVVFGDRDLTGDMLLDQTRYTQCALFAVEVALYRLLESWGIKPGLLAGHSIGELAAAHVAGVLSLDDACVLVAARSRLMHELPARPGAMVAISAPEAEVGGLCEGHGDTVGIAAVNGPSSVVISGDEAAVLEIVRTVRAQGGQAHRLSVSHAFHSPHMDPMLDAFGEVAAGVSFTPPRIPIVSTVTGRLATPAELCSAGYWVRHVRDTVRFGAAVRQLTAEGVTTFAELGPDGVLCALGRTCVTGREDVTFAALCRRDRAELPQALLAVAELHAHGVAVDWPALLGGAGRLDLPTYPFQRNRFWLDAAPAADAAAVGQLPAGHPMLGAVVTLPSADSVVLTGRLSAATQPWLADHVVNGSVVLPGTGFVELAVRAGDQTGFPVIEELTLEAPLLLPDQGRVALQVVVGPADGDRRSVSVYGRSADAPADQPWTRHAAGTLSRTRRPEPAGLTEWPPAGAVPLRLDRAYERLLDRGYRYGPTFQGLRAAWRRGAEVYAEVALPPGADAAAASFGLHPALFDAAMHADLLDDGENSTLMPFVWNDVTLHAAGAPALRVHITRLDGGEVSAIEVADGEGRPVASVGSLVSRPMSRDQLAGGVGAAHADRLFRVGWVPGPVPAPGQLDAVIGAPLPGAGDGGAVYPDLAALAAAVGGGAAVPEVVALNCAGPLAAGPDVPAAAHALTTSVLATLQAWLADDRLGAARLVLVTRNAVGADDVVDPVQAAVWGLARAAQEEQPGRIFLADIDGPASGLLAGVVAAGEPEAAIRAGAVVVPRLIRAAGPDAGPPASWPAAGTVLITGGTGGLGALVARHLATEHGVRHLLLVSRRGAGSPGAAALQAELTALGAAVTIAACDVADRDAMAVVLARIPVEHPLTVVMHAAGTADGGLIGSLTPEQLDATLRPKVDGAWCLHELTQHMDLSAFVLFSSAGGMVLAAGQANYAAANAFLDALARYRRAAGQPATALAWGMWAHDTGLGGELRAADLQRMDRLGLPALSPDEGLALLDTALASGHAVVAPLRVDRSALQARGADLPALLRGLVPPPQRRAVQPGTPAGGTPALAQQLGGLTATESERFLADLVRSHVAAVLGYGDPAAIDDNRAFKELGFDSLAAVELRNKLAAATGLALPATLVFDYPTARAAAGYLRGKLLGAAPAAGPSGGGPAVTVARDEPVAIIGMSCRYPGGVRSPEDLWQLLVDGTDAVSEFPANRGWDIAGVYDPAPGKRGKTYTREGGFLHDAADFDPAFFGIGPREALAMDPQQRLLLEASWEAIERARIDPRSLRGSLTGVFAGVMYDDYGPRLRHVPPDVAGYLANGSSGAVVSGRISYVLGLEGPSMTVDTACSSSLVTLHLAAQALRNGECTLALAGGVTVLSSTDLFVDSSRQGVLAPDGRSKSFSARADGVGWAEGAGLLLVERLSDAQRNGHPVLAVIRGSAVNQDGASNGLTAPNGPSQERVIRAALAAGGLSPTEVDAVEAHGSGTRLGDPIEAQALLATYGQQRPAGQPLLLGSVKSNIGHAQAAGGAAAVIKVVQALRHGLLPKSLHADMPSPHVDWASGAVELLAEARPWAPNGHPRRAGVSSFGISGTNAHVIIEEAPGAYGEPASQPGEPAAGSGDPGLPAAPLPLVPLLISASTAAALREQAARLASYLETSPAGRLLDTAFSLATTRAALDHRAVVLAADGPSARRDLARVAGNEVPAGVTVGTARATGMTAFLFTGQGSQRPGMGQPLHATFPVFAMAFDAACAELDTHLAGPGRRPLRAVMWAPEGSAEAALLDETSYTQPALFAVEVALFRLLESWGIQPDLVAGHSIGELAAAHVAGVLDLPAACALVAARGRLMQELPPCGAMVAIAATPDEVRAVLPDGAGIAAVNGPASVVVSGTEAAVAAVAGRFTGVGRKVQRLRVSHAFHSALMEPMLAPFAAIAKQLTYQAPAIPVVSDVTGKVAAPADICSPGYWVRQVREPVQFAAAVATLGEAGVTRFAELGPDAVLTGLVRACGLAGPDDPDETVLVPLMRRGRPEAGALLSAVAELHTRGVPVDWPAFFAPAGPRAVDLPTYAFQRVRYWLDAPPATADVTSAGVREAGHPLLGAVVELPDTGGLVLTGRLSLDRQQWLADHQILGSVVLPGTAFVEMALYAGDQAGCRVVDELTQQAPLVLAADGAVSVRVVVGPDDAGRRSLSVYSRDAGAPAGGPWTQHAAGWLTDGAPPAPPSLSDWPPPGAQPASLDGVYPHLAGLGYGYGPVFRGLRAVWRRGEEVFAEVALPDGDSAEASSFGVHPALLDGALGAMDFLVEGGPLAITETTIPFAWNRVTLLAAGAPALRVRACPASGGQGVTLALADSAGTPVAWVDALVTRPVSAAQLTIGGNVPPSLLRIGWQPGPAAGEADLPAGWTLVGAEIPGAGRPSYSDISALAAADGGAAPPVILCSVPPGPGDVPTAARAATHRLLGQIRAWLDDPRFSAGRLVVLTSNAVAGPGGPGSGGGPDLTQAPLWGLVRAAQAENPGRIVLADADDWAASLRALPALVSSGEPEAAVRAGQLMLPRLERVPATGPTPPWQPDGTVLITGGAGLLGGALARHLVAAHGVRHLLLTSRRGATAPGAAKLADELSQQGASVTVAACDVADAAALAAAVNAVPAAHPLTAVVHAAGLMDSAILGSLTPQQVDAVLRAKVDGGWHLHELTSHLDLDAFVLYSSAGGLVLTAGQANYAAANTFLDALADYRAARGLAAKSLAWGPWAGAGGQVDLARAGRSGIGELTMADGLALFDAALGTPGVMLAPIRLEPSAAPDGADLPALLHGGLAGGPARRPAAAPAAVSSQQPEQLASLPPDQREQAAVNLVRVHTAAVLGYDDPEAVDPVKGFTDLGLDSLAALELRNRLGAATDLRLPATLIFDYPSARVLARYLLSELVPGGETAADRDRPAPAPPAATATADVREAIEGMDVADLVRAAWHTVQPTTDHTERGESA